MRDFMKYDGRDNRQRPNCDLTDEFFQEYFAGN